MIYQCIIVFLMLCMSGKVQADCIDPQNSLILSPQMGSRIKTERPVILGIVKNTQRKPIKNKTVTLYADGDRKVAIVTTDNNGVWSYRLRPDQALADGLYHTIQASVKSSSINIFWMQGTMFLVNVVDRSLHKSGNVDEENSSFNFPFADSCINTSKPIIVGTLLDSGLNPVSGKTVSLSIDSAFVGNAISDSNGVFSFSLSTTLANGAHTVNAHCAESSVDLSSISFTIDTVAPVAPVITTPSLLGIVSPTFTVLGTTEPYATVETFLDNDTYGQICYADETGAWAIDYTTTLGVHTLTAQAVDLAGNQGPSTAARLFIVGL